MSQPTKNNLQNTLPHITGRRLFASAPERQVQERRDIEKLTQYRRNYWQGYKNKIRRVFGTLNIPDYNFWENRAKHYDRTVWGEIYACACAYVKNTILAYPDILNAQTALQTDLRRIGNNINQAVRLGHIKAHHDGTLYAVHDNEIGQAVLNQLHKLEARITLFERDVTALIATADNQASHSKQP